MPQDIRTSVVRILGTDDRLLGTGFVLSDDGLIVTCSHVIQHEYSQKRNEPRPKNVTIAFQATGERRKAAVVADWWRAIDSGDVAFLQVKSGLPDKVHPLPLGSSRGTSDHEIQTFGFPDVGNVEGIWGHGKVRGPVSEVGLELLQLESSEITVGFSGAPVWDKARRRVIGMIVEIAIPDRYSRMGMTAFVTPAETLRSVCPILQVTDVCPYRGLEVFTEEHAAFFFGRKRVVDRLVNRLLQSSQFLAVFGPSGSGKSSVVQAGLIPQLRQGAGKGSDHWEFLVARPADDPFQQLAVLGLSSTSYVLAHGVREWLNQHPERQRLVLVLDQFEELFTSCPERLRRDFLIQLTSLFEAYLPITLVVVMRDDFYHRFAQHENLMEWLELSRGPINVPPTLKHDELSAIAREPAHTVGLRFEEGLVETIVKDAIETTLESEDAGPVGRSTILPLLEFALMQLWEEREEGMLTHKAYGKIGGVTGGLKQWADRAFRALEKRQQSLAIRIFTDLVHLGDESQGLPDSRRRKSLDALCRQRSEWEDVYYVVRQLANARLLVTTSDRQTGEETVEIIHDALLREWELLRFWIERDRRFLSWHQEMERRAQAWKADRDEEKLLRARELKEAENWLAERGAELGELELAFISASQEWQAREEARWHRLSQIALVRQLATRAEEALNQQPPAQEFSLLLAVEAMRRLPCTEANQALVHGLTSLLRQRAQLSHDGQIYNGNKHAHRDHVYALVFSPDSKYLATASDDGTAGIWEVSDGRRLSSLKHNGLVRAVAFSPDGHYLATASEDDTASVWEVSNGHQLCSLKHSNMVRAVSFSPDGRYLATASEDGTAGIWEVSNGRRLSSLKHDHMVRTVAFSPDGRYLATASEDGTARVWEVSNGQQFARLKHSRQVHAAVFSPDGRYLATASRDGTARVWEVAKRREIAQMRHKATVGAVVFSPDGQYIATASGDKTAGIWDATSGHLITQMTHERWVDEVAFSPDGRYLATASDDGTARVWETADGQLVSYLTHTWEVKDVTFSPDGRLLATATEFGVVGVWEMTSVPQRANLRHNHPAHEVIFSPDGNSVATASHDEVITVWGIASGHQLTRMSHTDRVNALVFSPDGRLLASASSDQTAGVWEVASGNLVFRLTHEDKVRAVAFSPEGDLLVTASDDGTAKVWDVHSGRQLAHLIHEGEEGIHERGVSAVSFSPDGHSLATVDRDGTARGWDIPSGQPRFTLLHEGSVVRVAFSPDGRYLVTASSDSLEKIQVWDVQSRHQLASKTFVDHIRAVSFHPDGHSLAIAVRNTAQLEQWETWETDDSQVVPLLHDNSVEAVTFSPNGLYVATASQDCSAGIWEVTSGRQIARIVHKKSVHAVVFSPDGHYVATASEDGTVQVWLWQPEDLITEACSRLTRNLTEEEWQQYLGDEPYRKTCPELP